MSRVSQCKGNDHMWRKMSRDGPGELKLNLIHSAQTIELFQDFPFNTLMEVSGFPGGASGKETADTRAVRDAGSIPGLGRSPEEDMATHSSILAWRIPRTVEPGRLQSMVLTRLK